MNVWVGIYRKYGWKNSKFKKRAVGRIGSTVWFDQFTGSNWFDLMVRIGSIKWFELVRFGPPVRFGLFEPVQWFIDSNQISSMVRVRFEYLFLNQPELAKHTGSSRLELDCWPVRAGLNFFRIGLRFEYK